MKGTQFFWGTLIAGVLGFSSCGTMQQRERGEQREFKCGTTTASNTSRSNSKIVISDVSPSSNSVNQEDRMQTSNSVEENQKVAESHQYNNVSPIAIQSYPNVTQLPLRICTPLPKYYRPISSEIPAGAKSIIPTRKIISFLPNRSERKEIKEFVVSKLSGETSSTKSRGIDAGDFLPVEGIISLLAGLLGVVAGLQIFRLIFGITAVVFGMWGWHKRFNVLAKIGFWLGVVVLVWWGLKLISAAIL